MPRSLAIPIETGVTFAAFVVLRLQALALRGITLVLTMTALIACSGPEDTDTQDEGHAAPQFQDLADLKAQGRIRLVQQRWQEARNTPAEGLPIDAYERVAEQFAESHGLTVEWRYVDGTAAVLAAVANGAADVAVGDLTVTDARRSRVTFTMPITHTHEWILGRAGAARADPAAWADLRFGVADGSAYLETLSATPALADADIVRLRADTSPDAVIEALMAGRFDATVMDASIARWFIETHDDIARIHAFPERRALAWAVHPGAEALHVALNRFLIETRIAGERSRADKRDLPGIRETGRLRMLTVTGPHTLYLWRGELLGFEYELLSRFAEQHGLVLETVLAPSRDVLAGWLDAGRGDVLAAALTVTQARRETGYAFTAPYLEIDEVFVTGDGAQPIDALEDLAGRTVVVRAGSSHAQRLSELGGDFTLETVTDTTEEILQGVRDGDYDVTLADSHLLAIEQGYEAGLQAGLALNDDVGLAWAVSPEHTALREALNAFIADEYRGLHYNLLVQKYFVNERRIRRQQTQRIEGHALSPYDDLVQAANDLDYFDWRLIVAQMYEESGFDAARTSFAGARGLLQVMPRTARQLGVSPDALWEPEPGLRAGVDYLAWLWDRFPERIPVRERVWFVLAAYNAGIGHVRDARRLAEQRGLDPDRWFDNTEAAMLLLAKPEHARQARYGFVRGTEPVNYVREIRRRYRSYVDHHRALQ